MNVKPNSSYDELIKAINGKAESTDVPKPSYHIIGTNIAEKGGVGTSYDLTLSLISPTTPTIAKGDYVTFYTDAGNSYEAMVTTVSSTKVSATVYFGGGSAEDVEVGEGLKKEDSIISLLGATKDTLGGVMVYIDEEGYLCIDTERFDFDPILNNNSWADISKANELGIAQNIWDVGDCKEITLNGTVGTRELNDYKTCVYIIAFNHNEEYEGKGIHFGTFKDALIDGKDICLVGSLYYKNSSDGSKDFNMNHWGNYNYGGWAACDLRYDILGSTDVQPDNYSKARSSGDKGYNATENCATNPVPDTLMSALPEDLRAVMKPMTKYSDNVAGGTGNIESNVTTTIDYLPCLAEFEIFGVIGSANITEQDYQKQYAYYAKGNSVIKYTDRAVSVNTSAYRERSASVNSATAFCGVVSNMGGVASVGRAEACMGIAPIFKV